MKKNILKLAFISLLFFSCNSDENNSMSQQNTSGFYVNSEFYQVDVAYYIPDLSTEQLDDFFIVLTDGEIISTLTADNNFEFNDSATSSVIFRAIQDPNTPTAVNFAPTGSYMLNSNNENFSMANFKFNCNSTNNGLSDCQFNMIIDEYANPNIALIDIEHDNSAPMNYNINFNIELSENIISGQFQGTLETLEIE